jgi:hypothetical protein
MQTRILVSKRPGIGTFENDGNRFHVNGRNLQGSHHHKDVNRNMSMVEPKDLNKNLSPKNVVDASLEFANDMILMV